MEREHNQETEEDMNEIATFAFSMGVHVRNSSVLDFSWLHLMLTLMGAP